MPTVTLKVTDEARAMWQATADLECGGNISEWIRSVCDDRAGHRTTFRRLTGADRSPNPTRLADHVIPPERTGPTRPFRGPDPKDRPLRP